MNNLPVSRPPVNPSTQVECQRVVDAVVRSMLKKLPIRDEDDLYQEAWVAVLDVLPRYNPEIGKLSTFLTPRIRMIVGRAAARSLSCVTLSKHAASDGTALQFRRTVSVHERPPGEEDNIKQIPAELVCPLPNPERALELAREAKKAKELAERRFCVMIQLANDLDPPFRSAAVAVISEIKQGAEPAEASATVAAAGIAPVTVTRTALRRVQRAAETSLEVCALTRQYREMPMEVVTA